MAAEKIDPQETQGMEHGEQAGAVQLQTGTFWWTMGPTQPLIWVVTLA
eukprot:COSAG06_NODE_45803_length_352_cov_0.498024_1_plen_47_part_10